MNVISVSSLSAEQLLAIRVLYAKAAKAEPTSIACIDEEDPGDFYVLVYSDNGELMGYSELELYEDKIEIRSFTGIEYRKQGVFYAMKDYIADNFPDQEFYMFISDEKSAGARYMINNYECDIWSREIIMKKEVSKKLATNIVVEPAPLRTTFTNSFHDIFYNEDDIEASMVFCNMMIDYCNAMPFSINKNNLYAGIFFINFFDNEANLSSFGIFEKYRRRGYALESLKAIANLAIDNNCNSISVQVDDYNKPAIKLYKKAGFKETGRISLISLYN